MPSDAVSDVRLKAALETRAATVELQRTIVQHLRDLADIDTEAARDIINILVAAIGRRQGRAHEPRMARIRELFARNGNTPLRKHQIAKETGISRHALHDMLYKTHRHEFASKRVGTPSVFWMVARPASTEGTHHAE